MGNTGKISKPSPEKILRVMGISYILAGPGLLLIQWLSRGLLIYGDFPEQLDGVIWRIGPIFSLLGALYIISSFAWKYWKINSAINGVLGFLSVIVTILSEQFLVVFKDLFNSIISPMIQIPESIWIGLGFGGLLASIVLVLIPHVAIGVALARTPRAH